MNAERQSKSEEIYHTVLAVPTEGRAAFLAKICGHDLEILREVESLLSFVEVSSALLDHPPADIAAQMLSDQRRLEIIGTKVGRYKIESLIGIGGMGEVYLAQDTQLERSVAVKFIKSEYARDPGQMRRFMREAKTASSLNHPNIMTVYEVGISEDTQFIAAEFIEGKTLRQAMKEGSLIFDEMLEIISQIATALNAAHSAGIIHRDIKPENIILRRDKLVKVLDFGLAKPLEFGNSNVEGRIKEKAILPEHAIPNPMAEIPNLTVPGLVMGTASYRSPEQARLESVDGRSDIWSLGVVFYEMFAGYKPFAGKTSEDLLASILKSAPAPLGESVPEELKRIINKALQKNADQRYQTARELLQDLIIYRNTLAGKTEYVASPSSPIDTHKTSANTSRISSPDSFLIETASETSENRTNSIFSPQYLIGEVKKNTSFLFGVCAVFIVAVGFFSYFYFADSSQPFKSVAVLPFVNETGNADLDYLSDGLSDLLIERLSELPQLKVIARSSSFRYRGKDTDIGGIAKALEVQAILTGRVDRRGDDLQINLELIDAGNNTRLWGDSYSRKVTDLQIIKEEIARIVSQKLRLKLSPAPGQQTETQLKINPVAYQLYLNGVYHRRKGGHKNVKRALDYQMQAVSLDPNFALAFSEMAVVYSYLLENGVINPQTEKNRAQSAVEKALSLDETLAEAHLALARIKNNEFDWERAEVAFKRAIELNPNLARAHSGYARYLSNLRRVDQALQEIKKAQEQDPLGASQISIEGSILCFAGRYDEALDRLQQSLIIDPELAFTHAFLGITYTAQEKYRKAIDEWQLAIKYSEKATTTSLVYLGQNYAKLGQRDKALEILKGLQTTSEYVSPTELAILYNSLGDKEKAFISLEKAYAMRDIQLQFLKVEPGLADLWNDPRFIALLDRIGLG